MSPWATVARIRREVDSSTSRRSSAFPSVSDGGQCMKTAIATALTFAVVGLFPAKAQQITGTPGLPGATTTIDGKQLPPPDPKFGGVIKDDALQSKPWWAPRVVPPKGAPNVLLIITDDAGFGVPSTFGGVIPTP